MTIQPRSRRVSKLLVVLLCGSLGCPLVDGDGMGSHACPPGYISPDWPFGFSVDHYEPRGCPVTIADNWQDILQSSGWVWAPSHAAGYITSGLLLTRPSGAFIGYEQRTPFFLHPDENRALASHSVEYRPGGDGQSRCYDYAHYHIHYQAPTDYPPTATVAMTYRYSQSNPYGCEGGGGPAELRIP